MDNDKAKPMIINLTITEALTLRNYLGAITLGEIRTGDDAVSLRKSFKKLEMVLKGGLEK